MREREREGGERGGREREVVRREREKEAAKEENTDYSTGFLFHGGLQHTIRQPQHVTASGIVCAPNEKPEKAMKTTTW